MAIKVKCPKCKRIIKFDCEEISEGAELECFNCNNIWHYENKGYDLNENENQEEIENYEFMFVNIFLLILIDFVTLGFYKLFWLKKQEKAYKLVNESYELNMPLYFLFLLSYIFAVAIYLFTYGANYVFLIVPRILYLILCFIIVHDIEKNKKTQKYVGLGILLFDYIYLQYRINKDYKREIIE